MSALATMVWVAFIYVLIDPRAREIRYVGQSVNPRSRLWHHVCYRDKYDNPVSAWVRELCAAGFRPEQIVVEQTDEPRSAERRWIERLLATGCDLTNVRKGGASGPRTSGWKLSPETRERMRQAQLGKRHTDETRALVSAVQVGRKASAETRARMSEAQRRRWARVKGER